MQQPPKHLVNQVPEDRRVDRRVDRLQVEDAKHQADLLVEYAKEDPENTPKNNLKQDQSKNLGQVYSKPHPTHRQHI